jgi:hypothetical protein
VLEFVAIAVLPLDEEETGASGVVVGAVVVGPVK